MTETNRAGTVAGSSSDDNGADASEVVQVVLRERQGRDRGWWEQMDATFWPDSTVRLSWYEGNGAGFVAGSRAMKERGQHTVHHMFAPVAHVRDAKAYVEAGAEIQAPAVVGGVAGSLNVARRLNYRLERREDEWRILSLDAIYESTSLTPSVPGEQITIPADELAELRPSYALLAWSIAQRGQSMADDQLGDDQPQAVAAFYSELWQWLDS